MNKKIHKAEQFIKEAKYNFENNVDLLIAKDLIIASMNIFPNNAEATYLMGKLSEKENEYEKALDYYSTTVKLNPFYYKAYYRTGKIFEKIYKMYDKAKDNYLKAIQIKSNFYESYVALAELYEVIYADLKNAAKNYETAHKLRPDRVNLILKLAEIYERLKDFTLAKKYYKRFLEFEPKNPNINFQLGLTFKKLSNIEEGSRYYKKACELDKSLKDESLDNAFGIEWKTNIFSVFLDRISETFVNFQTKHI